MEHYLKIGEWKVVKSSDILITVLGSCIGLCLWDTEKKMGGMVHIMMPHSRGKNNELGKYADTGVAVLIRTMEGKGSQKKDMIAKLYGGASMFNLKSDKFSCLNIGQNNYIQVKQILDQLMIPITAEDVGGSSGRKIIFNCQTGEIASIKLK